MKYDSLIVAHIGSKYGLYGDKPFDFLRECIEKACNLNEPIKIENRNCEEIATDLAERIKEHYIFCAIGGKRKDGESAESAIWSDIYSVIERILI